MQSNQSNIIPYVNMNGSWTVSDQIMGSIFDQLVEDGIFQTVFYDGRIKGKTDFIEMMQSKENLVQIILVNDKIIGITWLNGVSQNRAFSHFAFFKEAWGKYTNEMGKEVIKYWMGIQYEGKYLFDVLLGIIPIFNKRAHKFTQEVGYTRLGQIPYMSILASGEKEPAEIFYYGREEPE